LGIHFFDLKKNFGPSRIGNRLGECFTGLDPMRLGILRSNLYSLIIREYSCILAKENLCRIRFFHRFLIILWKKLNYL
jgi:hypothetical protein